MMSSQIPIKNIKDITEVYEAMQADIREEILDVAEDLMSEITIEHDHDESGRYTYLDYTDFMAKLEELLKMYDLGRR